MKRLKESEFFVGEIEYGVSEIEEFISNDGFNKGYVIFRLNFDYVI